MALQPLSPLCESVHALCARLMTETSLPPKCHVGPSLAPHKTPAPPHPTAQFGKGTLASDGVGLLAACCDHLSGLQPAPPRMLVCTHFHELMRPEVLPAHPQRAFFTMQASGREGGGGDSRHRLSSQTSPCSIKKAIKEGWTWFVLSLLVRNSTDPVATLAWVLQVTLAAPNGTAPSDERQQQEQQQAVFLYRLAPGVTAPSFGVHCARMCGVAEPLLARASEVIGLMGAGKPVPRLELPALHGRDVRCQRLVQALAAVDVSDTQAVMALLREAAVAEGQQQQQQAAVAGGAAPEASGDA